MTWSYPKFYVRQLVAGLASIFPSVSVGDLIHDANLSTSKFYSDWFFYDDDAVFQLLNIAKELGYQKNHLLRKLNDERENNSDFGWVHPKLSVLFARRMNCVDIVDYVSCVIQQEKLFPAHKVWFEIEGGVLNIFHKIMTDECYISGSEGPLFILGSEIKMIFSVIGCYVEPCFFFKDGFIEDEFGFRQLEFGVLRETKNNSYMSLELENIPKNFSSHNQIINKALEFNFCFETSIESKSFLLHESIEEIIRKIILDKNVIPTAQEISNSINMSKSKLHRSLEKEGKSFGELVKGVIIDIAICHLLNGNDTIDTIGYKVGYANAGAFTRAFKAIVGETPSEYRLRRILF